MSEFNGPGRIICPTETVIEDWIDYNGHLNMAFYNVIFDRGIDHLYDYLGVGEAYARSGVGSCFVLEAHVHYLQELSLGDEVEVHLQLVDHDNKRLHTIEQLYHKRDGYLAATSEQMSLHIDMQTRRSADFPEQVREKLAAMAAGHQQIELPQQVGHRIGIPRKS